MSIECDVIVRCDATSGELRALGAALWRWCVGNAATAGTGVYQYLDNQALSDLIAGEVPRAGQGRSPGQRPGVHLRVQDEVSPDRRAAIALLRRAMPARGVADVLVAGRSWDQGEPEASAGGARGDAAAELTRRR